MQLYPDTLPTNTKPNSEELSVLTEKESYQSEERNGICKDEKGEHCGEVQNGGKKKNDSPSLIPRLVRTPSTRKSSNQNGSGALNKLDCTGEGKKTGPSRRCSDSSGVSSNTNKSSISRTSSFSSDSDSYNISYKPTVTQSSMGNSQRTVDKCCAHHTPFDKSTMCNSNNNDKISAESAKLNLVMNDHDLGSPASSDKKDSGEKRGKGVTRSMSLRYIPSTKPIVNLTRSLSHRVNPSSKPTQLPKRSTPKPTKKNGGDKTSALNDGDKNKSRNDEESTLRNVVKSDKKSRSDGDNKSRNDENKKSRNDGDLKSRTDGDNKSLSDGNYKSRNTGDNKSRITGNNKEQNDGENKTGTRISRSLSWKLKCESKSAGLIRSMSQKISNVSRPSITRKTSANTEYAKTTTEQTTGTEKITNGKQKTVWRRHSFHQKSSPRTITRNDSKKHSMTSHSSNSHFSNSHSSNSHSSNSHSSNSHSSNSHSSNSHSSNSHSSNSHSSNSHSSNSHSYNSHSMTSNSTNSNSSSSTISAQNGQVCHGGLRYNIKAQGSHQQARYEHDNIRYQNSNTQITRLPNDGTRLQNDSTRQNNDNARLHNDNTRHKNDNTRLHNDSTRLQNDDTRLSNDNTRYAQNETTNSINGCKFKSNQFFSGGSIDDPRKTRTLYGQKCADPACLHACAKVSDNHMTNPPAFFYVPDKDRTHVNEAGRHGNLLTTRSKLNNNTVAMIPSRNNGHSRTSTLHQNNSSEFDEDCGKCVDKRRLHGDESVQVTGTDEPLPYVDLYSGSSCQDYIGSLSITNDYRLPEIKAIKIYHQPNDEIEIDINNRGKKIIDGVMSKTLTGMTDKTADDTDTITTSTPNESTPSSTDNTNSVPTTELEKLVTLNKKITKELEEARSALQEERERRIVADEMLRTMTKALDESEKEVKKIPLMISYSEKRISLLEDVLAEYKMELYKNSCMCAINAQKHHAQSHYAQDRLAQIHHEQNLHAQNHRAQNLHAYNAQIMSRDFKEKGNMRVLTSSDECNHKHGWTHEDKNGFSSTKKCDHFMKPSVTNGIGYDLKQSEFDHRLNRQQDNDHGFTSQHEYDSSYITCQGMTDHSRSFVAKNNDKSISSRQEYENLLLNRNLNHSPTQDNEFDSYLTPTHDDSNGFTSQEEEEPEEAKVNTRVTPSHGHARGFTSQDKCDGYLTADQEVVDSIGQLPTRDTYRAISLDESFTSQVDTSQSDTFHDTTEENEGVLFESNFDFDLD